MRQPVAWGVSAVVHVVLLAGAAMLVVGMAVRSPGVATELQLRLVPEPVSATPPPPPVATTELPPTSAAPESAPRPATPKDRSTEALVGVPLAGSFSGVAAPAGSEGWRVAGTLQEGGGAAPRFQQPIPERLRLAPAEQPPANTPGPVRVGGEIEPPALVHRVDPEYPDLAVWGRVEGEVELRLRVGADGRVEEAAVVGELDPLLDEAAVEAVRQWRYAPLHLNGTPFPFLVDVTIEFRLRGW